MYRQAATLILTIPKASSSFPGNYGALMMKRTKNASFMPNSYVFPGGTISKADSSELWMTKYKLSDVNNLTPQNPNAPRPPILIENHDEIPRTLSLRITAIRETFEESGILMLQKKHDIIKESDLPPKNELKKWRDIVLQEPNEFYNMCLELGALPKINSLYEWSNWLTPVNRPKRFDVMFFLTNLPHLPSYAEEDGSELVSLDVMHPMSFIREGKQGTFEIPPPQFIELSRLAKMPDHSALLKYAKARQNNGLQQWCPRTVFAEGPFNNYAVLNVMPGDDLYTQCVTGESMTLTESEDEHAAKSKNLNRTIWMLDSIKKKNMFQTTRHRTNQETFDDVTLTTTPLDYKQLEEMLKNYNK